MAKTTVFYNGVRDIVFEVADKAGKVHFVRINGSGAGLQGPDARPLPGVGAYGITPDVDADVWEQIVAQYGEMAIFKDGFIRAGASDKDKAAAKEVVSAQDNGQAPAKKDETAGSRKKKK